MVHYFLAAILLMLRWLLSAISLLDGTYAHQNRKIKKKKKKKKRMHFLFLSHKSLVSCSIPSFSLMDDTWCNSYPFLSRVSMMAATLSASEFQKLFKENSKSCLIIFKVSINTGVWTPINSRRVRKFILTNCCYEWWSLLGALDMY